MCLKSLWFVSKRCAPSTCCHCSATMLTIRKTNVAACWQRRRSGVNTIFSVLFKYWFLPLQKLLLCNPADGQTIWEITTAAVEMCVYKITQSDKVSDKKHSLSLSCERFMACLFALSKLPFSNILGPSVFLTSGRMSYVHDTAGIFESAPRQRPLPAPRLIFFFSCWTAAGDLQFFKIPLQIFQTSHPWAFL